MNFVRKVIATFPGGAPRIRSLVMPGALTAVALLAVLPAWADTSDGFRYTDTGSSITILGYGGPGGVVVIPDTIDGKPVTRIEYDYVLPFSGRTDLTGIVIPDSVVSIGDGTFGYCDNLASVTLGNGLQDIGDEAFKYCSSLASITIPDAVTRIGARAFALCTGLTSISIPDSVTELGDEVCQYCTSLTNAVIGNGTTGIGFGAFHSCTSLSQVMIGASVTSIGEYAFSSCASLTAVTIPDSVESIATEAFALCRNLGNVAIGAGLADLGGGVFAGCRRLEAITVDTQNTTYSSADGVLFDKNQTTLIQCPLGKTGEYTVPAGVTSIGYSAFESCTSLTGITVPAGVTTIGYGAFALCTGLTRLTMGEDVTAIGDLAFQGCTSLASLAIPHGVTRIGQGLFSFCAALTSISIPDSVTSIGASAFHGCASLAAMALPEQVTAIGSSAFQGCTSLTDLTLPDGLTAIGSSCFAHCTNLTHVTLPQNLTRIGASAFEFCTSLTDITLPVGVTRIDDRAFHGCTGLGSITLPDSVSRIENEVFLDCTGLTGATLGTGLTSIGARAFSGCSALKAITVAALNPAYSSVNGVVYNEEQTTLVLYPGGVRGGFTVPAGVTSIGSYAFAGCAGLTDVTIPAGVTIIGYGAFDSCTGLFRVALPAGLLEIRDGAFNSCASLAGIVIPASVTRLGDSAFASCAGLTRVHCLGNAPNLDIFLEPLEPFYETPQATVYYLPGTWLWGAAYYGRPTAPWTPWLFTIELTNADKNTVEFGVQAGATSGYNNTIDIESPPPPGTDDPLGGVFFADAGNNLYQRDVHGFAGTDAWHLEVVANQQPVTLVWDANTIPAGWQLVLREVNVSGATIPGTVIDMATANTLHVLRQSVRHYVIALDLAVAPQTVDLTLAQGWNLVCLPVEPADPSVDAVLGAPSRGETTSGDSERGDALRAVLPRSVWRFANSSTGTADYELASEMHAWVGYWVYSTNAMTIPVTGMPLAASQALALAPGWNLVGPVADAMAAPMPNQPPYAWWWCATTGGYHGLETAVDNFNGGKGYWLFASHSVDFVFEGQAGSDFRR